MYIISYYRKPMSRWMVFHKEVGQNYPDNSWGCFFDSNYDLKIEFRGVRSVPAYATKDEAISEVLNFLSKWQKGYLMDGGFFSFHVEDNTEIIMFRGRSRYNCRRCHYRISPVLIDHDSKSVVHSGLTNLLRI